jgi:hypothetical protein
MVSTHVRAGALALAMLAAAIDPPGTARAQVEPPAQPAQIATPMPDAQTVDGSAGDGTIAPTATDVPVQWRMYPAIWTADDVNGPTDGLGRSWHDVVFDDGAWSGVSLPTSDFDIGPNDRYFRGRFNVDVLNETTLATLYFISDDGVTIYVNGQPFKSWGNGWRNTGCINSPPTCVNSAQVPLQVIPSSMLRQGENIIAVDLWNASTCCFYFFNAAVSVTWFDPDPPPTLGTVLLVHGFQGFSLSGSSSCRAGFGRHGDPGVLNTFGDMADWFKNAGFEVWIAHLDTNPALTPPIVVNGDCLNDQVRDVAMLDDSDGRIVIVAHSMGGLVARSCLGMAECRNNVEALYTLGSPHAGINYVMLAKLVKLIAGFKYPLIGHVPTCLGQFALCEFSSESMFLFNRQHPIPNDVAFGFIGGTNASGFFSRLLQLTEGKHDSVVGANSAVGLYASDKSPATSGATPQRYWVKESHSLSRGAPSYFHNNGGVGSQAFRCTTSLMDVLADAITQPGPDCRLPNTEFLTGAEGTGGTVDALTLPILTSDVAGDIGPGQTVTHAVQVDTSGQSIFHLMWLSGTLSFSLTRPDGLLVTPAFAAANPSVVAYEAAAGGPEMPPAASYLFTATLPGTYTLAIGAADDVGMAGTSYVAFSALDSPRNLVVQTDAGMYRAGQTAEFTATLTNGAGAAVEAVIAYADGISSAVPLIDQGNGVYRGSHVMPDRPGYATAQVKASGSGAGGSFTRQVDTVLAIAPHTAQFTGAFADRREDADGDGFGDALAFDSVITASQPGTYTLSADLMAGTTLVTHEMRFVNLTAGTQTVTLGFAGDDIRAAQRDGPYTVASLTLSDLNAGALPSDHRGAAWTTGPYRWSDFGVVRRHLPAVIGP